ncbi:hypothetical protein ACRAWF_08525 [Streptomyces sp. L7]
MLISLNSSALYLGMAAAGGTGSLALSLFGDRWFLLAGAGLALLATVVATLTTRPAPQPRVSTNTPEPART